MVEGLDTRNGLLFSDDIMVKFSQQQIARLSRIIYLLQLRYQRNVSEKCARSTSCFHKASVLWSPKEMLLGTREIAI
jgi:hypothetical protein